mmetsp:Transcript_26894/g.30982  ORF Transcript_26894/g.30982 Transcript_26894/m.30982 type:complete len:204 (+) Transcript_26894:648-1259(+)
MFWAVISSVMTNFFIPSALVSMILTEGKSESLTPTYSANRASSPSVTPDLDMKISSFNCSETSMKVASVVFPTSVLASLNKNNPGFCSLKIFWAALSLNNMMAGTDFLSTKLFKDPYSKAAEKVFCPSSNFLYKTTAGAVTPSGAVAEAPKGTSSMLEATFSKTLNSSEVLSPKKITATSFLDLKSSTAASSAKVTEGGPDFF